MFLNPRLVGYVPNPPPHVGWASTGIHIQSFLDVANDDTPLHAEALVHFGVGSAAGSFPSRARPPKDEILLVAAGVWSPIRTCSRVRDQSLTRGRGDNPEPRAQALVQVGGVLAAPVGVEDHTFDVAAPDGHGLARRFRFRVLGRTLQEVASSAGALVLQILGAAILLAGLALFAWSLYYFATRGRGTLAQWDPPRALVVGGPYRFVRNPMISGVIFVVCGEALVLLSLPHAIWAATFIVINIVYIRLVEESSLETRFGGAYREYTRHVRRFVPHLRPWRQGESLKRDP